MKRAISAFVLAGVTSFVLGACSRGGNNGGDTAQSPQPNPPPAQSSLRYELIEGGNGCSTGPHISVNQQQLCLELQRELNNRFCAPLERQAYFAQACPGQAWDPRALEIAARSQPGPRMRCQVSSGTVWPWHIVTQPSRQTFRKIYEPTTIIPGQGFVVSIDQTFDGTMMSVRLQVMSDFPNGMVLGEVQKRWNLAADDTHEIVLKTRSPKANVRCQVY